MIILCFSFLLHRISLILFPLFEPSNKLKKQEKHQNYDRIGDHESQEKLGLKSYVRRQQVRENL
jgi:hypothetical protein